ncbi:unnamed protein product [Adineta ricciae]|uniref:N-acetyltransferase domain-containing protein n=1 Tax=Adineta ricciae TaxID=249248 RepID=A0A814MKG4_ADIRI|nr:unnamed protein product [Adineta ricciae]
MDNVKELLTHRRATADDCNVLVTLINDAYSGQMSHQGWTNEYALNPTPRTNSDLLLNLINNVNNIFLMFFGADDQILKGCVLLSHKSECKTARISLLSVRPDLQARGFGNSILSTAEKPELISYYSRRGFIATGARQRFVPTLSSSGCAVRDDLELCTMRKKQGNGAYLMGQNEKSTDIFIINVSALLPEEECPIQILYITKLPRLRGNKIRLVVPITITFRYKSTENAIASPVGTQPTYVQSPPYTVKSTR